MTMTKIGDTEKKLLDASLRALKNAHTLWGLKVGAAVLAEDGQIYEGCNVESWVSGLGTCAERCAIDHAVLHGNRKIRKIAIVMDADSKSELRPCGACLQYISDFSLDSRVKVLMAKEREWKILPETIDVKELGKLLPFSYRKRSI
jgi:cytidine deaminase